MKTALCDTLRVEHPIIAAPTGPDLNGPWQSCKQRIPRGRFQDSLTCRCRVSQVRREKTQNSASVGGDRSYNLDGELSLRGHLWNKKLGIDSQSCQNLQTGKSS